MPKSCFFFLFKFHIFWLHNNETILFGLRNDNHHPPQSLQPPNAGYFERYKWCFKKLIPSYAVWPRYRGNDQRPNSVCSADIKRKNNLPPQMKYLLESHVCAFKWLDRESSNWMSRNIEGTGVVLIVFQSNWSTIFWRVRSIRFPTTNEILPHNDWFVRALVSKPAGWKKRVNALFDIQFCTFTFVH